MFRVFNLPIWKRSASGHLLGTVCVWAIATFFAISAFAQDGLDDSEGHEDKQVVPVLTVTGHGNVDSQPDTATVQLGIESQADTADKAQSAANSAMKEVLKRIKSTGVAEREIQTSRLSLAPIYSQPKPRQENQSPKIIAYRASNTIQIKVHDLERIGQLIDAGLKGGANRLQGVTFALEDELQARSKALAEAGHEARAKAQAVAAALDLKLTSIRRVQESSATIRPVGFAAQATRASSGTPVEAGEIHTTASLSVEFEIADKTTTPMEKK